MKRDPVKALLVIWSLFIFFSFRRRNQSWPAISCRFFPRSRCSSENAFDGALEEETLPAWIQHGIAALVFIFCAGLVLLKCPQAGIGAARPFPNSRPSTRTATS